eukprot:gene28772-34736_t
MIEIKNVSKWYGPVQVLNDCSVSINKGDVVVVCGPSGSGKSTLIKTVNALEPFQKGEITVDGVPLHDPRFPQQDPAALIFYGGQIPINFSTCFMASEAGHVNWGQIPL